LTTSYDDGNNSAVPQSFPSPLLKVNEIEIYLCHFLDHPMIRSGPVAVTARRLQLSEVIPAGANTATLQLFPQAVLSFATVFFGALHGQDRITRHGYTLFGTALKQLNLALSEPKCYTRDDVIISVITLALLEFWVPSGPKHYLKHIAGVERLLELRGPDPKSLELYRGLRHMILFASLSTRKPSILAGLEWKKAFRVNCSEEESQKQDLYDVLADCTVLVAERDVLATWVLDLERYTLRQSEIEKKALLLLTNLRSWKMRWDNDKENSYVEISVNEDDPPPFRTILEFSSDSAATMLLFYNSALIHVLQILASLQLDNSLSKDEYIAAERSAAFDICRCIPYYLVRKSHLDLRCVHLAVVTAWKTLRHRETADGRWLMDILSAKSQESFAPGLWAD
jgi:hypothetical protein